VAERSGPPASARAIAPAPDAVQIFIDADGNVTICDLWDDLVPLAAALGEVEPACAMPPPSDKPPSAS
jgi:hypothetical protein